MPTTHQVPRMSALLEAAAAEISVVLPDLGECRAHDGVIDHAEVGRRATRTPAVYVAALETGPMRVSAAARQVIAPVRLAAYVVTRSAGALDRGTAARNIVDRLLALIPRACWGLTGIGRAENVRAVNRYSAAGDKAGVAIWSIEWDQELSYALPDPDSPAALPSELYVTFDERQSLPNVDEAGAYGRVA